MNVKVYDNRIIAPCKCGTRYLDKIWDEWEDTSELTIFVDEKKWKSFSGYFIYRPPMEWFVSALHTEIINRKDTESVDDILDRFLSPKGTTHWADKTLKGMWELISSNRRIKPIPLSQLSVLVRKLGITPPKYDAKEYDFHYLEERWIPKETIIKDIERDYPIEWEWLMSCIEEEEVYYNKIANNEWKEINII